MPSGATSAPRAVEPLVVLALLLARSPLAALLLGGLGAARARRSGAAGSDVAAVVAASGLVRLVAVAVVVAVGGLLVAAAVAVALALWALVVLR